MAHGAAEHKVCVVHGRGSQRARWGHLGPGHLGAQGASMVRAVDYCNEQIQPNPPEKSQITPAQRPRPWPPGCVPCRCPSSQGVVLSAGAAVPWRGSARRHKGCPGTASAAALPLGAGEGFVPGRPWVGRDATREQCGSSRACREAVQSSRGSAAPPCAAQRMAPRASARPWAFHLGFSLAYA